MAGKRLVGPQGTQRRQEQPNAENDGRSNATDQTSMRRSVLSAGATLGQNTWWNELDRQSDSQWNQNQIIQVAQHWYEIRNQINRAEGIGDHAADEQLSVPRRPWVASGQVQGIRFNLEMTDALL